MDNPYPIKTVFTIPEAAAAIQAIAYPVKADWVRMKPIADELKLAIQSGGVGKQIRPLSPRREASADWMERILNHIPIGWDEPLPALIC